MEAVIHVRFQPHGDEAAVSKFVYIRCVAQQVGQCVRKAFDLIQPFAVDAAARPDDRIAGRDEDVRSGVRRPGSQLEHRVKQSCTERKFAVAASDRSRSVNIFQAAIDARQTSGFSILLMRPTNRVASRRGSRLVSRKFMSSWATTFAKAERTDAIRLAEEFACHTA